MRKRTTVNIIIWSARHSQLQTFRLIVLDGFKSRLSASKWKHGLCTKMDSAALCTLCRKLSSSSIESWPTCLRFIVSMSYYGLMLNSANLPGSIYLNVVYLGIGDLLAWLYPQVIIDLGKRPVISLVYISSKLLRNSIWLWLEESLDVSGFTLKSCVGIVLSFSLPPSLSLSLSLSLCSLLWTCGSWVEGATSAERFSLVESVCWSSYRFLNVRIVDFLMIFSRIGTHSALMDCWAIRSWAGLTMWLWSCTCALVRPRVGVPGVVRSREAVPNRGVQHAVRAHPGDDADRAARPRLLRPVHRSAGRQLRGRVRRAAGEFSCLRLSSVLHTKCLQTALTQQVKGWTKAVAISVSKRVWK